MRRFAWLSLLALTACQTGDPRGRDATGSAAGTRAESATELASPGIAADDDPPGIALVTTRPGARESGVWFQYAGHDPKLVGRIRHLPDAEARGSVLGRAVFVVADSSGSGEDSFGAALYRVEERAEPSVLVEGCAHASRPWVTPNGHVLVQRGEAGAFPSPEAIRRGELRTDSLSIDDVDPHSGRTRTLHEFSGYITHLAAVTATEAVLYRVAFHHADLVAVDLKTSAVRVLAAEIPAFARDFALDAATGSLLFTNRDAGGWVVERVSLSDGRGQAVARAEGPWAKPAAWPRGGLLLNDARGGEVRGGPGPSRALGAGFDSLRSVSASGRWAALIHERPAELSVPYWVELATSRVELIPVPPGARVDIAGWAP